MAAVTSRPDLFLLSVAYDVTGVHGHVFFRDPPSTVLRQSSFAAPTSAHICEPNNGDPRTGWEPFLEETAGFSPSPSPTPQTSAADDAWLEWVNAAYSGRPQVTLPYGLGDTTDLTNTLSVLKLAGLRAVVESHDTIRLADGRRARFPDPHSASSRRSHGRRGTAPVGARTVTATQIALAEQTATVLLVDVDDAASGLTASRRSGRRSGGRTPPRSTSPSPSRGCSPSTAPPSTGWCGPG